MGLQWDGVFGFFLVLAYVVLSEYQNGNNLNAQAAQVIIEREEAGKAQERTHVAPPATTVRVASAAPRAAGTPTKRYATPSQSIPIGDPKWSFVNFRTKGKKAVASPGDKRGQYCPQSKLTEGIKLTKQLRARDIEQLRTKSEDFKCAIITAVFGTYESRIRPATHTDSIRCDKFAFSDRPGLKHDGSWQVITTPYHLNNTWEGAHHTRPGAPLFNIAKFYKIQFHRVPFLRDYKVVVWVDGHVRLTNPHSNEMLIGQALNYGISCVKHDRNHDSVAEMLETRAFVGIKYPIASIYRMYTRFLHEGFCPDWWRDPRNSRPSANGTWPLPCAVLPPQKKFQDIFCGGHPDRFVYHECGYAPSFRDLVASRKTKTELAGHARAYFRKMTVPDVPLPNGKCRNRPDWENSEIHMPDVWGGYTTSLITYHIADPRVQEFLDIWWEDVMASTVQDQVVFPYAVWRSGYVIHQWPDEEYKGDHNLSNLHDKGEHGTGRNIVNKPTERLVLKKSKLIGKP